MNRKKWTIAREWYSSYQNPHSNLFYINLITDNDNFNQSFTDYIIKYHITLLYINYFTIGMIDLILTHIHTLSHHLHTYFLAVLLTYNEDQSHTYFILPCYHSIFLKFIWKARVRWVKVGGYRVHHLGILKGLRWGRMSKEKISMGVRSYILRFLECLVVGLGVR